MSPLIDVTNTSGQSVSGSQYTDSPKKSGIEASKLCLKTTKIRSEKVIVHRLYRSSKVEAEAVAIKMCNTKVSCSGKDGNCQAAHPTTHLCPNRKNSDSEGYPTKNTDVILSQAVQTLSLQQVSTETHLHKQRQVNKHIRKNSECIVGVQSKSASSSSGLPENPDCTKSKCTPQQCGACGLEFTSLPRLTHHLTRHVYDGLYAAQWLAQAMKLVNSRQTTTVGADSSSLGNLFDESLLQSSADD